MKLQVPLPDAISRTICDNFGKTILLSLFVYRVAECHWRLFLPVQSGIGELGAEPVHDVEVCIAVSSPPHDGVVRQEVLCMDSVNISDWFEMMVEKTVA